MRIWKEIIVGLLVLICISNISAFAISSDYWSGHSLQMTPSESKEFSLGIQNLQSTSDLKVNAVIVTGSDVLNIADPSNVYTVPAGGIGNANFIATVPADAKPGQVYNVKIDFTEVKAKTSSGEFGLGMGLGQSFDIVVVPGENTPAGVNYVLLFSLIGGAIIVLLVVWLILMKVKKGKKSQQTSKKSIKKK